MRYSIFYCTGDVTGVEIKRNAYFQCLTNHHLSCLKTPLDFFDVPIMYCPRPFDPKPVYYDIQCNRQQLYLTVETDEDKDGRTILRVKVLLDPFLNHRVLRKESKFIQTLHQITF